MILQENYLKSKINQNIRKSLILFLVYFKNCIYRHIIFTQKQMFISFHIVSL